MIDIENPAFTKADLAGLKFHFCQTFEEYVDYDAIWRGTDEIVRLTIVDGQWAYVVIDGEEFKLTLDEAKQILGSAWREYRRNENEKV